MNKCMLFMYVCVCVYIYIYIHICIHICVCVYIYMYIYIYIYTYAQSSPTLCYPVDYSLPGSSIHRVFQARILEIVVISYSRGSSWPRNQTHVSCISCISRHLYHCTTCEAHNIDNLDEVYKFSETLNILRLILKK